MEDPATTTGLSGRDACWYALTVRSGRGPFRLVRAAQRTLERSVPRCASSASKQSVSGSATLGHCPNGHPCRAMRNAAGATCAAHPSVSPALRRATRGAEHSTAVVRRALEPSVAPTRRSVRRSAPVQPLTGAQSDGDNQRVCRRRDGCPLLGATFDRRGENVHL